MKESTTVATVLLNWNTPDLTIACIESLQGGSRPPDAILVIDNASSDDSADKIRAAFPSVELIVNRENKGFTGGVNQGVEILLRRGFGYVWVLNNDTKPERHCLRELMSCSSREQADVTTAKILTDTNPPSVWYAGGGFRTMSLSPFHITDHRYQAPTQVTFVSGCCMLLTSDSIRRVGAFDDLFFAYGEDADWCKRASDAGLRMIYCPKAILVHAVSSSFKKAKGTSGGSSPALQQYLSVRNRLYLLRRYAKSKAHLFLAVAMFLTRVIQTVLGQVLLGRWEKVAAIRRALKEGLTESIEPQLRCIDESR